MVEIMKPGTIDLRAAVKNLDPGQQLALKGKGESFLITNVRGAYVLTHNNKKVMQTKKAELIAKAVMRDKNGALKGTHPKADKEFLRGLGLSPEIVIPVIS
jgi:hypothetical protein